MRICVLVSLLMSAAALAQWDVIDEQLEYDNLSYSNKDILISDSGFVTANGTLTLNNCRIMVEGRLDCDGDIFLNNSTIEVKGVFNVAQGVSIVETGASSVVATGDSQLQGKVKFLGNIYDKIIVYSDYVAGDTEFLIIDPNSSDSSVIENVVFNGGFCNIWVIDKRLDTPINNCFFFGAKYGIWQDGIFDLTDIRFCLFVDNYDTAITLIIKPRLMLDTSVLVDNVIIDNPTASGSFGCVVAGVSYPDNLGIFKFTNSIITNTYCGWYIQPSTYVALSLKNMAYYNNAYNDNLPDSSGYQQNRMRLTQSPFEAVDPNSGQWPYFLDEQGPAASVVPDYSLLQVCPVQLQTSLFSTPVPRTSGIGVGVPLPFDYATKAFDLEQDFNNDSIVNNLDFATFADYWRIGGDNPADFNDSNSIDTGDVVGFCDMWLCDGSIRLNIAEDNDTLTVSCKDARRLTDYRCAYFLDGRYLGVRDSGNAGLTINKDDYPNGMYYLRAVIIDDTGNYATASYILHIAAIR